MQDQLSIRIGEQQFIFYKEKVAYWENEKSLLLADVHAGKASLFRNNGIPLSNDHLLKDLNRLEKLITHIKPESLMVLGDLFHSEHNSENELLVKWVQELAIPFTLIEGNHDLHSEGNYSIPTLKSFETDHVILCHEECHDTEKLQINGHLHPAYRIHGKARQSMKFPCFHIGKKEHYASCFWHPYRQ